MWTDRLSNYREAHIRLDATFSTNLTSQNILKFLCLILTLILLTWTKWRVPTNASKWRIGFNSAFKGLIRLPGDDDY